MVNYSQLVDLDPSKLSAAAEEAGALSGQIASRGGELASIAQIPNDIWDADDASFAERMMAPLANPLYDVSDSAGRSQGVLEILVNDLMKAKEMLSDAHDYVSSGGLSIDPDGTIRTPVVADPDVAAANAERARQGRQLIAAAIAFANNADDVASGALASVRAGIERFLGVPTNPALGTETRAQWAASHVYGRAGDLATGIANGPMGRLAAIGPNGQRLHPDDLSRWQRFKTGFMGRYAPSIHKDAGLRSKLLGLGKAAGGVGGVLNAVVLTADQMATDAQDPNMGEAESGARALYRGAVQGGGAWAGGVGGAHVGMALGAVGGPAGIAAGAVVGGLIGGFAGSEVGDRIVDSTIDSVGNAAENVGKAVPVVGSVASDALDRVTPW